MDDPASQPASSSVKQPSKRKKILISLVFAAIILLGGVTGLFLWRKISLNKPSQPGKLPSVDKLPTPVKLPAADDFVKLSLSQRKPPFFTLAPATTSRFGILPQETFRLVAKAPVDLEFLRQNLVANAQVTIEPQDEQNKTFIVRPVNPLGTGQLLQMKLPVMGKTINDYTFDRNYGWSFQTQGKFRVVSHIPGDEKTGVPSNTGIEITFSQDDYQDPQGFIEIKPSIEFRLERHDETLAIVPLKPLLPKTVYTVTLKKGLNLKSRNDPITEDFSFSFQTAEPQKKKRSPFLNLADNFVQTRTTDPAQIRVFTAHWQDDPVKTQIYQFPSIDSFVASREKIDQIVNSWMNYYADKEPVDTRNLSLVAEVDLPVQTKEGLKYLQLPDKLPAGFYLVRFLYGEDNKLEQLWLQVTDLAAYISVGKRQTVIWVNQLDSGQPAQQATIRPVGTALQFTTNGQGVAVFDTPSSLLESKNSYIKITSQDGKQLVLPAISQEKATEKTADDYWSYLYHERLLYKPTDTLYFWGVAKERDSNQPPPAVTVTLEKNASYYSGAADSSQSPVKKTIALNPDGSFYDSLELVELPPGWYTLTLRVGKITLATAGLQIIEFVKPEMKIEVTGSRKAIFSHEKLDFTARVSFFDGTPAKNIPLKITEEYGGATKELTTDDEGKITYTYQAKHSDYLFNSYQCLTFSPALVQEGLVEGHSCVLVFNKDVVLTTVSSQQDNKATLKATVRQVDLDAYNANPDNGYQGKPVAGQRVTFEIHQRWWEKVEKGTYYDFIEKTTRPRSKYIPHDEVVETKEQTTDNAGETAIQFTLEKQKSYLVVVSTLDSKQRQVTSQAYFYYSGVTSYATESTAAYPQLILDKKENVFSLGETVAMRIQLGEKDYPDTSTNRFLFILAQRGRQTITVLDQPQYSFTFAQNHIPNVLAAAIIFTGSYYQVADTPCLQSYYHCSYYGFYQNFGLAGVNIFYRKDDSQLSLKVDYDKPVYQPGDKARITVQVKNKDGQPVANAQTNLVLVDEALEGIGGVLKPSPLGSLYSSVNSDIYFSYYSHQPILPPKSEAEMGGGGGGERSIFKDTAFFGSQLTDGNGRVVFSVQLPDNITSWRVYAQAVSAALEAGQQKSNLIVTQDFFVVPAFPRQFLAQDRPLLLANAFGKKLDLGTTINYQATFSQAQEKLHSVQSSVKADRIADFPFPQLSPGNYQLALEGSVGSLHDKIVLPFEVLESRFAMQQQQTKILTANQKLTPPAVEGILRRKPFTLVISDEGKGKYYWQLIHFCYQTSNRLEKNLARLAAGALLQASFAEEKCQPKKEELVKFQAADGGVSQVWWGGSELKSTVWAVSVDASPFDKDKLISYLTAKFNQTSGGRVQKILAAWGLTNLGEPRISDLRFLASEAVSFEEKIFAALALAQAGEIETARQLYYDILADYGYASKPYVRIQTQPSDKQDVDKMVQDSSLALLLGVMVESEYNRGLYAYIRDFSQDTREVVLDLAQIAFIKDQIGKLPAEVTSLKYTSPSRTVEKELKKEDNSWIISLKPEERNNFTVEVLSGKAEIITSYYIGAEGLVQQQADPRLKLTRTYRKANKETGPIVPGDIIEVSLSFDFDPQDSPRGAYTITDILPSGLAYLPNPQSYGLSSDDWVREQQGNVVSTRVYNLPWWLEYNDKNIIYYARVKGAGTYEAEPALFQSEVDASVFTYTASQQVTINKD